MAGALQLVLTVAQEEEGSAWLACARFFDTLQAVGQWLLSPGGGGTLSQQPPPNDGQITPVFPVCHCKDLPASLTPLYWLPGLGEQQEPESQATLVGAQSQWTRLVSLQGLLVRSLAGRQLADRAAVAFAVAAHWRLVTALEPPAVDSTPSLTLAAVQVPVLFLQSIAPLVPKHSVIWLQYAPFAAFMAAHWCADRCCSGCKSGRHRTH